MGADGGFPVLLKLWMGVCFSPRFGDSKKVSWGGGKRNMLTKVVCIFQVKRYTKSDHG